VKKFFFFFALLLICSCGQTILDKPKNLLDKDKMAEVLADLSLNDQSVINFPNSNIESGSLFILQQHKVKKEDFASSYNYYLVNRDLPEIIEKAQEIIKKKDPKGEKFINDKLKGQKATPKLDETPLQQQGQNVVR
jgi:hypothetical protein